jgi:hypothetical protein
MEYLITMKKIEVMEVMEVKDKYSLSIPQMML